MSTAPSFPLPSVLLASCFQYLPSREVLLSAHRTSVAFSAAAETPLSTKVLPADDDHAHFLSSRSASLWPWKYNPFSPKPAEAVRAVLYPLLQSKLKHQVRVWPAIPLSEKEIPLSLLSQLKHLHTLHVSPDTPVGAEGYVLALMQMRPFPFQNLHSLSLPFLSKALVQAMPTLAELRRLALIQAVELSDAMALAMKHAQLPQHERDARGADGLDRAKVVDGMEYSMHSCGSPCRSLSVRLVQAPGNGVVVLQSLSAPSGTLGTVSSVGCGKGSKGLEQGRKNFLLGYAKHAGKQWGGEPLPAPEYARAAGPGIPTWRTEDQASADGCPRAREKMNAADWVVFSEKVPRLLYLDLPSDQELTSADSVLPFIASSSSLKQVEGFGLMKGEVLAALKGAKSVECLRDCRGESHPARMNPDNFCCGGARLEDAQLALLAALPAYATLAQDCSTFARLSGLADLACLREVRFSHGPLTRAMAFDAERVFPQLTRLQRVHFVKMRPEGSTLNGSIVAQLAPPSLSARVPDGDFAVLQMKASAEQSENWITLLRAVRLLPALRHLAIVDMPLQKEHIAALLDGGAHLPLLESFSLSDINTASRRLIACPHAGPGAYPGVWAEPFTNPADAAPIAEFDTLLHALPQSCALSTRNTAGISAELKVKLKAHFKWAKIQ